MTSLSRLSYTAKLICVDTLLFGDETRVPGIISHNASPTNADRAGSNTNTAGSLSSKEYMLQLLETGCFTAVSEDILRRVIEHYPFKLTNRLLMALLPPYTREINLLDCKEKLTLMGLVEGLKKCSNLQKLSLQNCSQLLHADLFTLVGLMNSQLTCLVLEGNNNATDDIVQASIRALPNLTSLNISCCASITDDVFLLDPILQLRRETSEQPMKSEYRYRLSCVDMSGNSGITSVAVRHLSSLCGPNLRQLNLAWSTVDSTVLFYLAGYNFPTIIDLVLGAEGELRGERELKDYLTELKQIKDLYLLKNEQDKEKEHNASTDPVSSTVKNIKTASKTMNRSDPDPLNSIPDPESTIEHAVSNTNVKVSSSDTSLEDTLENTDQRFDSVSTAEMSVPYDNKLVTMNDDLVGSVNQVETSGNMRDGSVNQVETSGNMRDGSVNQVETSGNMRDGSVHQEDNRANQEPHLVNSTDSTEHSKDGIAVQNCDTLNPEDVKVMLNYDDDSFMYQSEIVNLELDSIDSQNDRSQRENMIGAKQTKPVGYDDATLSESVNRCTKSARQTKPVKYDDATLSESVNRYTKSARQTKPVGYDDATLSESVNRHANSALASAERISKVLDKGIVECDEDVDDVEGRENEEYRKREVKRDSGDNVEGNEDIDGEPLTSQANNADNHGNNEASDRHKHAGAIRENIDGGPLTSQANNADNHGDNEASDKRKQGYAEASDIHSHGKGNVKANDVQKHGNASDPPKPFELLDDRKYVNDSSVCVVCFQLNKQIAMSQLKTSIHTNKETLLQEHDPRGLRDHPYVCSDLHVGDHTSVVQQSHLGNSSNLDDQINFWDINNYEDNAGENEEIVMNGNRSFSPDNHFNNQRQFCDGITESTNESNETDRCQIQVQGVNNGNNNPISTIMYDEPCLSSSGSSNKFPQENDPSMTESPEITTCDKIVEIDTEENTQVSDTVPNNVVSYTQANEIIQGAVDLEMVTLDKRGLSIQSDKFTNTTVHKEDHAKVSEDIARFLSESDNPLIANHKGDNADELEVKPLQIRDIEGELDRYISECENLSHGVSQGKDTTPSELGTLKCGSEKHLGTLELGAPVLTCGSEKCLEPLSIKVSTTDQLGRHFEAIAANMDKQFVDSDSEVKVDLMDLPCEIRGCQVNLLSSSNAMDASKGAFGENQSDETLLQDGDTCTIRNNHKTSDPASQHQTHMADETSGDISTNQRGPCDDISTNHGRSYDKVSTNQGRLCDEVSTNQRSCDELSTNQGSCDDVSTNQRPCDDVSANQRRFKPGLVSLDITNIKFISIKLGYLCLKTFLAENPGLQKFDMSWKGLTEEFLKEVIPNLRGLRDVSLEECTFIQSGGLACLLKECQQLRNINLRGVVFIKDMAMSPLYTMANLRKLNLAESEITDSTLFRIANRCNEKLTELDLSWCEEITEKGVNNICLKCIQLESLVLRSCPVSNITLQIMSRNCHKLTELLIDSVEGVSSHEFSDAGLMDVAENLRQLHTLDISWNLSITNVSVYALMTSLTRLTEVRMKGLKQITCTPFLQIISGMIYENGKLREFWVDEYCNSVLTSSSLKRSTVFATDLRVLDLEYCDLVEDKRLELIVKVCRGSLLVNDYYGRQLVPDDTSSLVISSASVQI